jgi:coenzyme F420-reducing hydrogenase beta subunit
MIELSSKYECTGCLACINVECDFLKSEYDDEGFIQPVVNEKCNECGRCAKVCPRLVKGIKSNNFSPKYYACMANDDHVLKHSSSGGMFSVLAPNILKKNGVVFGAAFNNIMQLKHIAVEKEEDLPALCGSKYLQSDVTGCYRQIKTLLSEGRIVLFCGLPCQIDGLNSYLGTNHFDGLITIDILCKGVPSPGVFSTFVAHQEKKIGEKITNIIFRDKSFGWGTAVMGIYSKNGLLINLPLTQTSFGAAFSTNLIMRNSCYQCSYRGVNRLGDISLGDFWGLSKNSKLYNEREKGVSLLSVNTPKGEGLFSEILTSIKYESADISNAILNNSALRGGSISNRNRTSFFKCFKLNPQKALLRYTAIHRILVFFKRWIKSFN